MAEMKAEKKPANKSEVVITAYGIISPIGLNCPDFKEGLFAGRSGVRSVRGSLAPENFPVPYAAWIPRNELPPSILYKGLDESQVLKSWLMTEQAVYQTLKNVNPKHDIDAIVYGTADGVSYEIVSDILSKGLPADFNFAKTQSESSLKTVHEMTTHLGFRKVPEASIISLNSACATGNQTVGIAWQGIRSGRWKRCLVGGVDARCEASNFLNFYLLGALTTDEVPPEKASRPFAKDRSGFVRGEGAAVLLLESREEAEARGAEILAVVSGYSNTSDAFRLTDGRDDAMSVMEAMRQAISSAGLTPNEIDYINAHGTSTPLNDRLETLAIKKLFGEKAYKTPVSSIKSQIGHSTIAASAIEAVACVIMLNEQKVSPTINYNVPDPECDLDYVPNVSRNLKLSHVLSNSFGFGGQNTCTVISKNKV